MHQDSPGKLEEGRNIKDCTDLVVVDLAAATQKRDLWANAPRLARQRLAHCDDQVIRDAFLSLQDEVLSSGFVFLMGRKFNKLDLIIDVIFMFNFANINRFYSLVRS